MSNNNVSIEATFPDYSWNVTGVEDTQIPEQAVDSATTNLGAIIATPKGRKIAYAIYAGISLVVGNTAVGLAAANLEQPIWLIIASAVVANLAAPFSALAIANAKTK